MLQAQGNEPRRMKTKMLASQPVSMNTSDPLPSLLQGDYPVLDDVILRHGRIESRPYMSAFGIETGVTRADSGGISCTWQDGDERYGFYAETGTTGTFTIKYQSLAGDSEDIKPIVFFTTSAVLASTEPFTELVPAGNKVFAFRDGAEPLVIEWSDFRSRMEYRLVGFTQAGYANLSLAAGTLTGEYIYGVELVRKRGDATIASGGIHRSFAPTGEIRSFTLDSNIATVTADLFMTDYNWTHIRLWRTKRLDVDPDTDVVRGQRNIMFALQEIERVSWGGTFASDQEDDENLPLLSLGALEATDGSFELLRLPSAKVAHFHENKLWFAGTDLDEDKGQKVYLSKSQYTYAESYDPLDGEPTQNHDTGHIQGIFTVDGDIIIVRHSETGRIPAGDTLNGYYPTDRSRGFSRGRMGSVYGIGLFACSPAGDIYRLGGSRRWEPVIAGSQTRLRGEFQEGTAVYFSQYDGNVLVHEYGGYTPGAVYVLNINDGLGWSRLLLADTHGTASASAIWDDPLGERTVFLIARPNKSYIHTMALATGDAPWALGGLHGDEVFTGVGPTKVRTTVSHRVMFPPFQDGEGRAVYEHTYFSLIASLLDTTFTVECIGPDRDTVISSGLVEPSLQLFSSNLDKDLFLEFTMQPDSPVYGTRVCYSVTNPGPFLITSAQVECMLGSVQARNYRPDLIPAEVAAKDPLRNRSHWVTRGNPTRDIIGKQNIKEVT